jgi:dTDP-4-amino-4,6-dideoxygalactose transaminase
MAVIEHSTVIKAEPKAVTDVVLDPELIPVWFPSVHLAQPGKGFPRQGGELQLTYQAAEMEFNVTVGVFTYEENRLVEGRLDGMVTGAFELVFQSEKSGTHVAVKLDCEKLDDRQLKRTIIDDLREGLENVAGMVRIRTPLTRSAEVTAREYLSLKDEIDRAFQRVLLSGVYTQEEETAGLEEEFATFCGVRYAINTSSGTTALLVAIRALGVGPGDEVITACYDDHGPPVAITNAGAMIRFVDIEEETLALDPNLIEAQLTSKTRAILPVHIHGQVAEMDPIREIAEEYDLLILEDGALATGAMYRDRRVGSLADAGAFSFGPGKIFSGFGWGGMVTTDDPVVAARAAQFAGHGPYEPMRLPVLPQVTEEVEGYSSLMSSLLAAGLRVKLPHLDEWVERRRAIARRLDKACDRLGLGRLHPRTWTKPAPRSYIVRYKERDTLLSCLKEEGLRASATYVPPMHLRKVYIRLGYQRGDFPVAERVSDELIGIPIHPQLTDEEVETIIEVLERCLR